MSRILTLTFAVILSGCSSFPDEFTHDNPEVRKRQKEQSEKLIPAKSERVRLARQTGAKVFMIVTQGGNSGRGAAVSQDGYLLTAYHVVQSQPFYLQEVKITREKAQQLEADGFLLQKGGSVQRAPGRIVWSDAGADLAIVKFNHPTPQYFSKFKFPSKVNGTVYSTDDYGLVEVDETKLKEDPHKHAVGNGPFFAAGKISFSQLFPYGPGVHTIGSNLIARGGMSGGPFVTRDGRLCGVLSQVGISPMPASDTQDFTIRSTARMLPPHLLKKIIRSDRAQNRSNASDQTP